MKALAWKKKKRKGKEPQDRLHCLQALLTSPAAHGKPIKTHVTDERFMIKLNGGGFGKFQSQKFHFNVERNPRADKKKKRKSGGQEQLRGETLLQETFSFFFFKSGAIMSTLMKTIWKCSLWMLSNYWPRQPSV